MTRREAVTTAVALGASLAWPSVGERRSLGAWRECRECYPHGVASGDPTADGMILWTRRPPFNGTSASRLALEIATDEGFRHVVSRTQASVSPATDWTCRVLVVGLAAGREYWYRFTDEHGLGSRIGRTLTMPAPTDNRPLQFAFVSCQNMQLGACNAYRRMIWEDERRSQADRLAFVLHLGDFVYEIVWYREDRKDYYARRVREVVRYAHGEKHGDFHVPTTVDDYRALYRAYLLDPDLQDARARWPFVPVPDNHEFSWKGWQSQESFGSTIPAQTRKVAANQAWFEYQPARVVRPGRPNADEFLAPRVADVPLREFDADGLGLAPDNLAAIRSLRFYRTLRLGANAELILTDNRSFRSEPLTTRPEAAPFRPSAFPGVVSEDVTDILDAGASAAGATARTISFGGADVPNPRRSEAPLSMLGAVQKSWFLDRLHAAATPWKLWGNSVATLDWRTDFQNMPNDIGPRWPTTGYALFGDDDWSGYRHERAEIFDFVEHNGITGLAMVCGDRHAFLAGVASSSLPPHRFRPVAAEFVTGSISAPGLFEAMEFGLPRDHPLRPVYVHQSAGAVAAQPAINLSMMHGVRSSLELQRTGDLRQALAASNPEVAPHLSFVDVGGHGYSVVRVAPDDLTAEFVCIPRPLERSSDVDGGPLAYRVAHRVRLWTRGEAPSVVRTSHEGALPLVP